MNEVYLPSDACRAVRVIVVPLAAWCLHYPPFPGFLVLVCAVCECVSSGCGRRALSSHLTLTLPPSHLAHLWLIYPSPPPAAALFNLHSRIPQRVCEHRAALCSSACLFPQVVCSAFPLFSCIHIYLPSWHLVTSEKIRFPASTCVRSTHVLEATCQYFFSVQRYSLSVSNSAFGLQLQANSNSNTSHNFLKHVLTQKSMTQRFLTLKEAYVSPLRMFCIDYL